MPEPAASLESLDENGNGVRVEFTKQGDRFGHTIYGISGRKTLPLLQSVEGTPDDFSPPSPPFVELHEQNDLLFLSGATSIGHWSASMTTNEHGLVFDVACRMKGELPTLGSVYRALRPGCRESLEFQLERAELCEPDRDLVQIAPNSPRPSDFPATVQWRYSIKH